MDVDPLASMRCWAVELTLGGREYEIPALPAVDWWPVLVRANPGAILDILPSSDELDEQLLSGEVTGKEMGLAFTDAIEEVTGRSMHAAFVLAVVAESNWPSIGGQIAQTGFRWDTQPIGAALDMIYAIVIGGMKTEDSAKFIKLLKDEHLTTGKRKPIDRRKVVSEFEAMAGPRPAPKPRQSSAEPSDSEPPKTPTPRQPRRRAAPSSAPRKPPAPPA